MVSLSALLGKREERFHEKWLASKRYDERYCSLKLRRKVTEKR